MSKRTEEEMAEFYEDMKQDNYEEMYYEKLMYSDDQYAISKYMDEITEAYEILANVSSNLSGYGHEYTPKELFELL